MRSLASRWFIVTQRIRTKLFLRRQRKGRKLMEHLHQKWPLSARVLVDRGYENLCPEGFHHRGYAEGIICRHWAGYGGRMCDVEFPEGVLPGGRRSTSVQFRNMRLLDPHVRGTTPWFKKTPWNKTT